MHPQIPGVMTRGIEDPATYYYRRLFTDAVRAVDAARTLEAVDPDRVAVVGGSQGGGTALAVAGLVPDLRGLVAQVPFLCDFPRAIRVADTDPYREVARYLATHRDRTPGSSGRCRTSTASASPDGRRRPRSSASR